MASAKQIKKWIAANKKASRQHYRLRLRNRKLALKEGCSCREKEIG